MFQRKRVIGLTCANKIELPILGRQRVAPDEAQDQPSEYSSLPKGCSDRKYLPHRSRSLIVAPDSHAASGVTAHYAAPSPVLWKASQPFCFFSALFCGADVICQQPAACTFKKISFTPRTIGESSVNGPFLSAVEPGNDFLGRGDKAKGARQIVGRPERENTQRNAAIN